MPTHYQKVHEHPVPTDAQQVQWIRFQKSPSFTLGEEKDRDDAYRRLQKFVDKLGIDLSQYSKALGKSFNDLKEFYHKRQMQLQQEQSLKNDRIELEFKIKDCQKQLQDAQSELDKLQRCLSDVKGWDEDSKD